MIDYRILLKKYMKPGGEGLSDKEKLIALLNEWGVGYAINPYRVNRGDAEDIVVCTEGGAKITGYGSFFTVFEFDQDGRFIQMGAWE